MGKADKDAAPVEAKAEKSEKVEKSEEASEPKKARKKPAAEQEQAPQHAHSPMNRDKKDAKRKWTVKNCQKFAKRFASEDGWAKGSPSSYKAAKSNDWLKDCLKTQQPDNVVSFKKLKEISDKTVKKMPKLPESA